MYTPEATIEEKCIRLEYELHETRALLDSLIIELENLKRHCHCQTTKE